MSTPVSLNINIIDQNNSGHLLVARSHASNVRIRKKIVDGGSVNEKIIYSLTGFVPKNKNLKIAKLYFKSSSGKIFKNTPTLTVQDSNVDLRLVQISTEDKNLKKGTTNNSKVFIYNLVYKGVDNRRSLSSVEAYVNYSDSNSIIAINKIHKVSFGSNNVMNTGEKREITVYGNPGLTVDIALNKIDNHIDSDGRIVNYFQQTILNGKGVRTRKLSQIATMPSGEAMTTAVKSIPPSGKCSFNVDFPNVDVKSTLLNGSRTGESRITLDDLTGVRVGDVLYSGVTRLGKVTVLNPLGNNANQCDISETITIANDVGVTFKRANDYHLNVYCGDLDSGYKSKLSSRIKNTDPTFVLKQYLDPALTLTVIANSGYTITHVDDVATSFSDGQNYIKTYLGRANKTKDQVKNISSILKTSTIKLTINAHSTNYFIVNRVPFFNTKSVKNTSDIPNTPTSTNIKISDFTNTNHLANGGTNFVIHNITSELSADGATSNGICTITFDITVHKWGTKDVDVSMDLNDLLTLSA